MALRKLKPGEVYDSPFTGAELEKSFAKWRNIISRLNNGIDTTPKTYEEMDSLIRGTDNYWQKDSEGNSIGRNGEFKKFNEGNWKYEQGDDGKWRKFVKDEKGNWKLDKICKYL